MLTKNRIIFFVYFSQLGFLLGNRPLTYLMIAYLTAEFAAIILVFTYYKIKQDGNFITHSLNIPGGALFVLLFCVIAFQLGITIEEIPHLRQSPGSIINPLEPFYSNIIPISFSFFGVIAALLAEVHQMKKIKRVDFLEREFIVQTLTVVGVIAVGLFTAFLHEVDIRIPIIAMGTARLGMEAYSAKKHLALKRIISKKIDEAKDRYGVH